MQKLLVLYATEEGQTLRIAEYARAVAERSGWTAVTCDVREVGCPLDSDADAIIIAASIHVGRHPALVHRLITESRATLERVPTAFISVSLSAAGERRTAAEGYLADFLQQTGWHPAASTLVAGALRYRQYGLVKRLLMKQIARSQGLPTDTSRDYEYTHWGDVKAFVAGFLSSCSSAAVPTTR